MGKPSSPEPSAPDPYQQASSIQQAQNAFNPQAAQLQYNILSNPQYGALPTTQLYENIRQQVMPNENAVRNQLVQNILQNLQSPTGINPQQQAAIDARRQQTQDRVVAASRNNANLGGNLYGGHQQYNESQAVQDLQNQWGEQDINRQLGMQQQAINNANPILQLLFGQQIQTPQYQSPVQSPDAYASGMNSYNNTLAQQQANQSQLYSALFGALGTAGGMALGGPIGGAIGGKIGSMGGSSQGGLGFRLGGQ